MPSKSFHLGKFLFFAAMAAGLTSPAWAQDPFRLYKDYDRYRYLPRLPQGNENPPPLPKDEKKVTGDTKVLVENLKGIVFVDKAADIVTTATSVTGVHVRGNLPILNDPEFSRIVQPYLGGQVSIYRLNLLVREVIKFYRDHDLPVVDVSVPEQDITTGIVQIVVTEGRLGKVRVQGCEHFDPCVLLDQVCLTPGGPIYESELMEEQRWLYRNPFRTVDLELTPGKNKGETDVVFNVHDKCPWRVYGGYEDTGTRATGYERIFAGVNWFNAFGQDDYLGYQYTANPDTSRFQAHSAFYTRHLDNRDTLSVYGAAAEYNATIPGFGTNPGDAWQVLIRWNHELCSDWCGYEHQIMAGFDFKQTNSALFFGPDPVFAGTFDVVQFMVGYIGRRTVDNGSWSIGTDFYFSPGNMSDHNTDADFQLARAGADSQYCYLRAFHDRRWWLNEAGAEFVVRGTAQWADGNLIPTEQLFFGGYNSIRGYDDYAVLGDSGYFMNLEIWSAPIRGLGCPCDQLRGLVFYDWGVAANHTLQPGEPPSVDLHSIGVGLRYDYKPNVQARFDYGYQLADVPGVAYDQRAHVGVVISR